MPTRFQARTAPVGASTARRATPGAIALACVLALRVAPAHAQEAGAASAPLPLEKVDARVRLGAERLHLPGGEKMGLVGLTELLNVGGEWWVGPGVYGAATGGRGGLFVPGVEGAWSHPFNDWLALDAGVFAGGGGGAAAPVGGGLMIRPHVDVVLRLPGFYTGPTWSSVRFVNGAIRSNQVGWMINFDSSFRYRPADLSYGGKGTDGSATGLGFDHIDAIVTRAQPRHSTFTSGGAMTQSVGLVGLRAERTIDGPLWAGIETAGAASGGVAGYAEVLGTAGLRFPVIGDRLSLGARGSLGLGGGGNINTGGGIIAKGAVGATLRLTDTLGIGAEAGLVGTRNGDFHARTASVSLNWALDAPTPRPSASWSAPLPADATRMEFASGVERYDAARKSGRKEPLDAVVLSISRYVTPSLYVTGQAHSAFAGGAGAYSVGLFGVGAQWPVVPRLRLGAEALAGAAGGGGVDTVGGAVLQARAYADVVLTDSLSLRLGGGRIRSVHGGLDAPVVDATLVFRFGVDRKR
jgi:hypothetical protein